MAVRARMSLYTCSWLVSSWTWVLASLYSPLARSLYCCSSLQNLIGDLSDRVFSTWRDSSQFVPCRSADLQSGPLLFSQRRK